MKKAPVWIQFISAAAKATAQRDVVLRFADVCAPLSWLIAMVGGGRASTAGAVSRNTGACFLIMFVR